MEKAAIAIGTLSLLVAIATFATPEIRCFVGLPSERCPSESNVNSISGNSSEEKTSANSFSSNESTVAEKNEVDVSIDNRVENREKYAVLEEFLANGNLVKADLETTKILSESEVGSGFNTLSGIPCETLLDIDQLWMASSNNKFGLTPQAKIQRKIVEDGSSSHAPKKWGKHPVSMVSFQEYGNAVGWRENSSWLSSAEISYSSSSPEGHLPWLWGAYMTIEKTRSPDFNGDRSNHTPSDWADHEAATMLGNLYEKLLSCNK